MSLDTLLQDLGVPKESLIHPLWYERNPEIEQSVYSYLTSTTGARGRTPVGYYTEDKINYPIIPFLLYLMKMMNEVKYTKSRTFREAHELISKEKLNHPDAIAKIANVGSLVKVFINMEYKIGVLDPESIEYRRLQRRQGSPKPHAYSKKVQVSREAKKKLTDVEKELKALERKKRTLKVRKAKAAAKANLSEIETKTLSRSYTEHIQDFDDTRKQSRTLKQQKYSDYLLDKYLTGLSIAQNERELLEMYREIMHRQENYPFRKIVFLPTPKQYRFLGASEDIVLFGGAAGGGKSHSLVYDPLRYAHIKDHNAVIIRKTMPELVELIDTSREMYPLAFPGASYKETEHVWTFPSGAKIRFGHLDRPADKFKYQGRAFTYIGFDELSQHSTSEGFDYLRSRLRRTNKNIIPYIRATANPGSQWVYEMFVAPSDPDKPFILKGTENNPRPITVRFIPSRLEDNPYLDSDGLYRSVLESLSEVDRRQLLEGDWLASNDSMFPEFSIFDHVVEPFLVPKHWSRVGGIDYGYRDPSAVVWFAVDPEDGTLVVYDELLQTGLTGRELTLEIMTREANELINVDHPIDWSVYARTGHTGPSIAESMLSVPGFKMRPADKNREAGWVQIHEALRKDPNTGRPKIKIFSTCKQLIRQLLGAKSATRKPNDLDTARNSDGHWDLLDALRYGVMSRPRAETFEQRLNLYKQENRWRSIADYFS
jgi:hypothetical protein